MSVSILKKEESVHVGACGLYQDAAKLGYTLPLEIAEAQSLRNQVLTTLREAGVDVFKKKSVEEYKDHKKAKAEWPWLIRGLCMSLMATVMCLVVGLALHSGVILIASGVCLLGVIFLGGLTDHVPTARWHLVHLSNYGKPIPEFAMQTAITIGQLKFDRSPVFLIDEMTVEQRVADPFLVVEIGGERFYVDVWDEPDFKAVRKFEN